MKLAIVGKGMMGRLLVQLAEGMKKDGEDIQWIEVIEPATGESLFDIPQPDVIIDFSHPDALDDIYRYVSSKEGTVSVVFGTTGFTSEQLMQIKKLSEIAPVIQSYNYSYGIQTLKKLIGCAVPMLKERSDIEIIEKHHRYKADAPSGTALMLAECCDPDHNKQWRCGREGQHKRGDEIGIHSLRGGTIFGEHHVIFALQDEVVTVSHTAFSKNIFAKGALEAGLWLNGKKKGMYSIEDVFY